MKKFSPILILLLISFALYRESFSKGFIPLPADTLIGSYFPWLDYKWGYETGVAVKNPPISDAFSQFFVWKQLGIDLIKKNQLPLWNKFEFAGTPLLATYHSSPFFPGNLLLLLPNHWNWSLYIFSSTLFAAISMYLFAGSFTKKSFPRLTASIVFALSGPMTTWVEFGTGVWAAGFLPLIFWLVHQYLGKKHKKYLFLLSLSLFSFILAGFTQLDIYLAILLPVYLLIHLKNSKDYSAFLQIIFALFLGAGLSSIQLLPTLELFQNSIRSSEHFSSLFNFGLTPIQEYIRLFAADFFGNPVTYNYYLNNDYHEFANFLGTLSLPLIVTLFVQIILKRTKQSPQISAKIFIKPVKFFGTVFFISLFLATNNPISYALFSLPLPLITYSSASRLFFLSSFTGAVLIAIALDKLFNKKTLHKDLNKH